MKREPSAFLSDIQVACAAVVTFTQGFDLDMYSADALVRSDVERQLQNMGETLSQLSRQDPDLAAKVPRHRKLIGFRNIVVHGYAGLNDSDIREAVQLHLPELQAKVEALIQEPGHGPAT